MRSSNLVYDCHFGYVKPIRYLKKQDSCNLLRQDLGCSFVAGWESWSCILRILKLIFVSKLIADHLNRFKNVQCRNIYTCIVSSSLVFA